MTILIVGFIGTLGLALSFGRNAQTGEWDGGLGLGLLILAAILACV
jgi:hypothetical protein